MILKEKFCQLWKLNWYFNFIAKVLISVYFEGMGFNQSKQLTFSGKRIKYHTLQNYLIKIVFQFLLFIPVPWREKFVYTQIQGTTREKYFNYFIYKGKMPFVAGNKYLFVHFFFHRPRLSQHSTGKSTVLFPQKWTSKWLFSHGHKIDSLEPKLKKVFLKKKLLNATKIEYKKSS